MTKPMFAGEPNMDDILASIRKMISEEPAGPRPVPDQMTRTVFSGQAQRPAGRLDQQTTDQIVTPLRAAPNYGDLPDAIGTAAPANRSRQRSLEDEIAQLLGDRPAPSQDPSLGSKPLTALSRGSQDPQSAARIPQQAATFDLPVSPSKNGTLPFGRRPDEARPLSTENKGPAEPSLDQAGKLGDTPKKSSLVASLEKAREDAEAEARSKKATAPLLSEFDAPAPEAVAAALFERSGVRQSRPDVLSPAANSANISPLGSQSKVAEARSTQPETARVDTSTRASDSGRPGNAKESSQSLNATASVLAAAKSGSSGPPSEALLDAVVDMVKNEPSSLSVFTSGSAFIHGVTGGEKPAGSAFTSGDAFIHGVGGGQKPVTSAAQPRKLDTAAAELLRPMLRQWLSDNMPRIVEDALRGELDSGKTAGDSTDKA